MDLTVSQYLFDGNMRFIRNTFLVLAPPSILSFISESSNSSSTLTCTSTGSPATNVSWTRNRQPLIVDGNTYKMSQTVTNRASSTYENVLIIDQPLATIIGSTFTCTVENMFGFDTSDSINITGTILYEESVSPINNVCLDGYQIQ